MCNIVVLKPGVMIPFEKLENCIHNNPHGYGLILRDPENKKLQIIRKCPEGGNDPAEIHDILEDNKDIERYLHLRWRTDGPVNLDNTHPFTAFHSNKRQVYFMHNGVLNSYRPKGAGSTYENGIRVEHSGEDVSDSRKFNDEFLAPYLLRHTGDAGKADIHDPFFHVVLEKFWGHGSRGLLISNDQEAIKINEKEWKELDFGEGKFWSSNDTYFDKLTRGPVYEAKKKEQEELAAKNRQGTFHQGRSVGPHNRGSNSNGAITELKDVNLKPKEVLSENLSRIFEDTDLWTDKGLASLSALTEFELGALVEKSPDEATNLLVILTSSFAELHLKYEKLNTKAN